MEAKFFISSLITFKSGEKKIFFLDNLSLRLSTVIFWSIGNFQITSKLYNKPKLYNKFNRSSSSPTYTFFNFIPIIKISASLPSSDVHVVLTLISSLGFPASQSEALLSSSHVLIPYSPVIFPQFRIIYILGRA